MNKINEFFVILAFIILSTTCSQTSDEKPSSEKSDNSSSTSSLLETLTSKKWNMMFNDQSYGTITFNADGTCLKTAVGMDMDTEGTWQLNEQGLTLNFPSEGDPFTGSIKAEGENLIVAFMDGAITYTYTPAE